MVAEALVDVYHRTDEVHADLIGGTNTKDVSPELLTFLDGPRRSALVNRDDELGDGAQDLEELGFCGFYGSCPLTRRELLNELSSELVRCANKEWRETSCAREWTSAPNLSWTSIGRHNISMSRT